MMSEPGVRAVVTLYEDGRVEFGPEYGMEEGAEMFWAQAAARTYVAVAFHQLPMVRLRLDGAELTFLNGYTPGPEAVAFWQKVREMAPGRKAP